MRPRDQASARSGRTGTTVQCCRRLRRAGRAPDARGAHSVYAPDKMCAPLVTYDRDDGRPVTTPVWFTGDEHKAHVRTGVLAFTEKRLRSNSRACLAPYAFLGTRIPMVCEGRSLTETAPRAPASPVMKATGSHGHRPVEQLSRYKTDAHYLTLVPAPEGRRLWW